MAKRSFDKTIIGGEDAEQAGEQDVVTQPTPPEEVLAPVKISALSETSHTTFAALIRQHRHEQAKLAELRVEGQQITVAVNGRRIVTLEMPPKPPRNQAELFVKVKASPEFQAAIRRHYTVDESKITAISRRFSEASATKESALIGFDVILTDGSKYFFDTTGKLGKANA